LDPVGECVVSLQADNNKLIEGLGPVRRPH